MISARVAYHRMPSCPRQARQAADSVRGEGSTAIFSTAFNLIGRRSRNRLRLCQHPYSAATKLNRKAVRTNWMFAPIRIDCQARRWRNEWPAEGPHEHCRWKDSGQALGQARQRLLVSLRRLFLPFGHGEGFPKTAGCHGAVKPSSPEGLAPAQVRRVSQCS